MTKVSKKGLTLRVLPLHVCTQQSQQYMHAYIEMRCGIWLYEANRFELARHTTRINVLYLIIYIYIRIYWLCVCAVVCVWTLATAAVRHASAFNPFAKLAAWQSKTVYWYTGDAMIYRCRQKKTSHNPTCESAKLFCFSQPIQRKGLIFTIC